MTIGVPIEEINKKLQPASEMRCKLDKEAVENYASILAKLPPVKLMRDNEAQTWWVVDGAHTISAALKAGKKEVQAEWSEGSYLDAWKAAANENQSHGVRVTNKDKRRRVEVAVKHPVMSKWAATKIAEACGVGRSLATEIKKDVTESVTSARVADTLGRSQPARKPRAPKVSPPATSQTESPKPERNGHISTPTVIEPKEEPQEEATPITIALPLPQNPAMPFNASRRFLPLREAIRDEFEKWPATERKSFARELWSIADELMKETGLSFTEVTLDVRTS